MDFAFSPPTDKANYLNIFDENIEKIEKYIDSTGVAIIPGFQGISKNGDITTIGRGGSDATAVAIAKLFNAAAIRSLLKLACCGGDL